MVLDNDIFKTFNGQKAAKVQVHLDFWSSIFFWISFYTVHKIYIDVFLVVDQLFNL